MIRVMLALMLTAALSPAPPLALAAPATVNPGDVYEVVASAYTAPQTVTLTVTGGTLLDDATWQATPTPGAPQIHTWRVRAGPNGAVVATAGDAQAVTNIRAPGGLCAVGCWVVYAPWVGRG